MSGLSRRNAFIFYTITLLILIALCFIFPWFNTFVLNGILLFSILMATIYYTLCSRYTQQQPLSSKASLVPNETDKASNLSVQIPIIPNNNPATQIETETKTATIKPTRLYYLDNLKSILTFIVVIHHVTCAFSGGGWMYMLGNYYNPFLIFSNTLLSLDQSYFMCLFFFISAYFTPKSCDRKGMRLFLTDKFKRLGIPFIIYTFILGPLLDLWTVKVAIKHNSYIYLPSPGPCWFLAWLLIFNVCYIIIDQNISHYQIQFPSLCKVIIFSFIMGFIQLIVVVLLSNGFMFMPITTGSLPFDILFFICGVVAQKNNWLSILSSYHVIIIRILTVLLTILITCAMIFAYNEQMFPQSTDTGCNDNDNDNGMGGEYSYVYAIIFVVFGVCCSVFSLFMIQCCALNLNWSNGVTKFFSKTAYTVYLIHPLIVVPVTWSFTEILYAFNGIKLVFCDGDRFSKTHFGNNWLVFAGWIYAVIVTLVCVWPLAWITKQIPGFNKIL